MRRLAILLAGSALALAPAAARAAVNLDSATRLALSEAKYEGLHEAQVLGVPHPRVRWHAKVTMRTGASRATARMSYTIRTRAGALVYGDRARAVIVQYAGQQEPAFAGPVVWP